MREKGVVIQRLLIVVTLAALILLPFALRPPERPLTVADERVIVITSHNEAIRREFARGFSRWYRERTGRTVAVEWRVIGGTSEILRFLAAEYLAAFRQHWTQTLKRPWSTAVERAMTDARLPDSAEPQTRAARAVFLESEVSCGIDVFFGGGPNDAQQLAEAGRIVASRLRDQHQDWFDEAVLPLTFAGESYRDPDGRWVGNVLSSYGILYNRDSLRRLGIERPPAEWADLADPRLVGEVALADPTKSSSSAKAFENILQQEMQRSEQRLIAADPAMAARDPAGLEARAVREGWTAGLQLLQRIAANARYFTDSSQQPPIDVSQGDCAAGICIDFYGRAQVEVTRRRDAGDSRLGFATPRGGTVHAVDPIAILRGAPHRAVAEAFLEYTLTLEGQKLWNFQSGTPGGPEQFALRRLPVRRDFYEREEWKPLRSDPEADPYSAPDQLIYRPERTSRLFREIAFVIRVMALDTHPELVSAWRVIRAADEPARTRAFALLQDVSAIDYERTAGEIKQALASGDRTEELRMARELGAVFRRNYAEAERVARGE